jgi:hypothetical protein
MHPSGEVGQRDRYLVLDQPKRFVPCMRPSKKSDELRRAAASRGEPGRARGWGGDGIDGSRGGEMRVEKREFWDSISSVVDGYKRLGALVVGGRS